MSGLPASTTHISGGGITCASAANTIEVFAQFSCHTNDGSNAAFALFFVLDGQTSNVAAAYPCTIISPGGSTDTKVVIFRLTGMSAGYHNFDGYIYTSSAHLVIDFFAIYFKEIKA